MIVIPRPRILAFRRRIRRFYALHGRDLPFRNTADPYRITVSEIMLQQTQVSRGLPRYEAWVARWPDWVSLAEASKRELLAMWSGLGYNRRALYLGEIARRVVTEYDGILPGEVAALEELPGIGRYTSRAILIFAHNANLVAVDTNIRRVILHEFDLPASLPTTDLEAVAQQLMPRGDARRWHYALMDYSTLALPKVLKRVPPKTRQSKFSGSIRQIRGEIIRQLTLKRSVRLPTVAKALDRTPADVLVAAEALAAEGVITIRGTTVWLRE